MGSQYLQVNNDSPETIIVKFEHCSPTRKRTRNKQDITHNSYKIL